MSRWASDFFNENLTLSIFMCHSFAFIAVVINLLFSGWPKVAERAAQMSSFIVMDVLDAAHERERCSKDNGPFSVCCLSLPSHAAPPPPLPQPDPLRHGMPPTADFHAKFCILFYHSPLNRSHFANFGISEVIFGLFVGIQSLPGNAE